MTSAKPTDPEVENVATDIHVDLRSDLRVQEVISRIREKYMDRIPVDLQILIAAAERTPPAAPDCPHHPVPVRTVGLRADYNVCRDCGMVEPRDGFKTSCKGPVRVTMRATPPAAPDDEQFFHPVRQVMFRAGLLACREYMARFVEAQDAGISQSIRANWWPNLGDDPGAPRKNLWAEWYEGEYPDGRVTGPKDPSIEALPHALTFLEQCAHPPASAPPAAPADAPLQRWGNAYTDEVGRKGAWLQREDGYWTPWHIAQDALAALRAERHKLETECEDWDRTCGVLRNRLESVCLALKGPHPEGGAFSWHDLGDVAATVIRDLAALRAERDRWMRAHDSVFHAWDAEKQRAERAERERDALRAALQRLVDEEWRDDWDPVLEAAREQARAALAAGEKS